VVAIMIAVLAAFSERKWVIKNTMSHAAG